jgi:hypothetical protein
MQPLYECIPNNFKPRRGTSRIDNYLYNIYIYSYLLIYLFYLDGLIITRKDFVLFLFLCCVEQRVGVVFCTTSPRGVVLR